MSTDSYILGFLHPRVLTPSGSYIYGGSYNHGFLHLGFLDLGVLMVRVPISRGSLDSRVHVTFRGLTSKCLSLSNIQESYI